MNCVCTEDNTHVSKEHDLLFVNKPHVHDLHNLYKSQEHDLLLVEKSQVHELHLVDNLNDTNHGLYNKIMISHPNTPNLIIATSFALIDTGALQGSYSGTWLLAHDLRQETQEHGLLVCSPINNACTPLTRTVIACVSIYDMSNDKKIVMQPVSYTHLTLPTIYSV